MRPTDAHRDHAGRQQDARNRLLRGDVGAEQTIALGRGAEATVPCRA